MPRVLGAKGAAELLEDGDTLAMCGQGSMLIADDVLKAIESRFLATGHPRNLTVFEPCNAGMKRGTGVERLGQPGLLKRVIASAFPVWDEPRVGRMIVQGEIEGYNFPMGSLYQLVRDIGAGRPGLLTQVGLHTFVDPRYGGGRLNVRTTEDMVRLHTLDGEDYLFYPAFPIRVALIRGTTADEAGNLSMEREPVTLGVLHLAIAAKNCGGTVIAQVERLAGGRAQPPKSVVVPGRLIDAIVVAPDQEQSAEGRHNPYITGELSFPMARTPYPPGPAKALLRRALLELRRGDLVNLGVGIPADLPALLLEMNAEHLVTFSTEHGAVGGIPAAMPLFGAHLNPEALLDPTSVFDLYDGGGLDISFLGLAQADEAGNINVSKYGGILPGCGGFIDITSRTRRLVFCGMFTAKGTKVDLVDRRLRIVQEGQVRKFLRKVDQVTLNGRAALAQGQDVTIITERCVLKLRLDGWELAELVPGVDVDRDLLPGMEFPIQAGPGCRQSPDPIYDMTAAGDRRFADLFMERVGAGDQ